MSVTRVKKQRVAFRRLLVETLDKAEKLIGPESKQQLQSLIPVIESKIKGVEELDGKLLDIVSEAQLDDTISEMETHTPGYTQRLTVLKLKTIQVCSPSDTFHPPADRLPSSNYKLKKLSVQKFSGAQLEWLPFKEDFVVSVHDDTRMPDVTKLRYLRESLLDDAAQSIAGLPAIAASYSAAWQILENRWGDIDKNTEAYINALIEMPPPAHTAAQLLAFHDGVETCIRSLKSLGKNEDTLGDLLTPIIKKKLPGPVRAQLRRTRGAQKWSFTQFRRAIYDEIEALNDGLGNEKVMSTPLSSTAAFMTTSNNRGRQNDRQSPRDRPAPSPRNRTRTCAYCKGPSHRSVDRQIVTEPRERFKIVTREALCFNCLGSHLHTDCRSPYSCGICNKPHHTSLHDSFDNTAYNSNNSTSMNRSQLAVPRYRSPSPRGRVPTPAPPSTRFVHSDHVNTSSTRERNDDTRSNSDEA